MKRLIYLIIACVFCFVVSGISYELGYENAKKENESKPADDIQMNEEMNESIGKIDYPLIDIAFNDGNEWAVVICNGIYSEKQTYLLCRDGRNLQYNKEYLSVITYPAGRGTTGHSSVSVYRNGEAIKHVECFEMDFTNEELKNSFEKISKEELYDYMKSNNFCLT